MIFICEICDAILPGWFMLNTVWWYMVGGVVCEECIEKIQKVAAGKMGETPKSIVMETASNE